KQGGYIPKLRELFVEGLRDNTSIPTGKIHEARADLGQLTKLMDEYSSTEKALEPSLPVRGLEGRPAGSTRKIPIEPKKEVTPPPGFEPKPYNFASGESILKESTPPQPLSDEALRGLRGLSRDIKVGGDKDDKKPKLSRQSRPKTVDGDKPERTDTDRKKVAELYVDMNSIFERVRSASPKSLSVVEHETLKGGFEINNRLLLEHYERLKARPPKSAQDNLAGFLEHIESKLAELVALKNQFYELLDEKKSEAVDDMLLEREIEAMRPQINARWREKKTEYYKGKDPSLLEQVLNDTKTQREDVDKVIASLIKRAKENRNA
ncbi:MAG: hypothetical protein Q8R08_04435, partial [bacterium]|nr:hypothetical protein [bacterium]